MRQVVTGSSSAAKTALDRSTGSLRPTDTYLPEKLTEMGILR